MQLDNEAIASATGDERKKLERDITQLRQAYKLMQAQGNQLNEMAQRPVTVKMLVTGAIPVIVNVAAIDAALEGVANLINHYGPDSTFELTNDDIALSTLYADLLELHRQVAPYRVYLANRGAAQ